MKRKKSQDDIGSQEGSEDIVEETKEPIVPPEIRDNIQKLANVAFQLFNKSEAFHPVESVPNIWEYHAGCKNWSEEEQATFNRISESFSGECAFSTLKRASLIAAEIPDKTIRDVVARMTVLKDTTPHAATRAAAATAATVIHLGGSLFDGGRDPRDDNMDRDAVGATDWKDPSSEVSHALNSARTTMPVSFGAPVSMFPYELQVSQLLQENLIIIGRLRENLVSLKVAKNVALITKFEENVNAIFNMLRVLPVKIPPLPIALKNPWAKKDSSGDSSVINTEGEGSAAALESGPIIKIKMEPVLSLDSSTHV